MPKNQKPLDPMTTGFRIESEHTLSSDWLPPSAFTTVYTNSSTAVATAIEGVDDPATQEVRVINIKDGSVFWCSTNGVYA